MSFGISDVDYCNKCGSLRAFVDGKCEACGTEKKAFGFFVPDSLEVSFPKLHDLDAYFQNFRGTIDTATPIVGERIDLQPLKDRMSTFEGELSVLKDAQDKLAEEKDEWLESVKEVKEALDGFEEIRDSPEVEEFRKGLESLENILQFDFSKVSNIAAFQMLKTEMQSINSTLSARIDANSEIREAYQGVIEQQRSLVNVLKWATILLPFGVAMAPAIELIIKWIFKIP